MDRSTAVLAFIGGLIAALLLVLIVVMLDGDGDGVAAAGSTSTTAGSTTSEAATSSTGSSTTTTAGASTVADSTTSSTAAPTTTEGTRCLGLAPMVIPVGAESFGGNGNFDGPPEPTSIMQADAGFLFEHEGEWSTGFSLNSGYLVHAPLPEPDFAGLEPTIVIASFDGDDGLLVQTDFSPLAGASVYTFFFLDADCQVNAAGTASEDPLEFLDWGGAAHTQGFTCTDTGVVVTAAGKVGQEWEIRSTQYAWTAPAEPGFTLVSEETVTVPDGDPAIGAAGIVDC